MGMTFVEALERVCDGGHLRIVAPYISPGRLRELMKRSARLSVVTDFVACFSVLSGAERSEMTELVCDHAAAFRHVTKVHAKVVFSQSRVLIGSANLTKNGFEVRDELGVLHHEATQLAEARVWFEDLWTRGEVFDAEYFRSWEGKVPAARVAEIPPFAPGIVSTRKPTKEQKSDPRNQKPVRSARSLEDVLRQSESPSWIRSYLGVVRWIYEQIGLDPDDRRLMLTAPKAGGINLTINNRWVLQHSKEFTHTRITLPMPKAVELARRYPQDGPYQFSPRGAELEPPGMVFVPGFDFLEDPKIASPYLKAIRTELRYGVQTPNRHHHRPDLLALALDVKALNQELRKLR